MAITVSYELIKCSDEINVFEGEMEVGEITQASERMARDGRGTEPKQWQIFVYWRLCLWLDDYQERLRNLHSQ